jgi:uncharacterized membrane protein required for colicin V production
MMISSLNWIDAMCLAITLVFALIGMWVGLIKTLFHLGALILAVASAWNLTTPLALITAKFFNLQSIAWTKFLLVIVLFFAVYLTIWWLGKRIHKFLHQSKLGLYNRLGGSAFGIAISLIICSLIMTLLLMVPPEFIEPHRQNSYSIKIYKEVNPNKWLGANLFNDKITK